MIQSIVMREFRNGVASEWRTVNPRILSRDEALKEITKSVFKMGHTPEAISDGKKIIGYRIVTNDRVIEYKIIEH